MLIDTCVVMGGVAGMTKRVGAVTVTEELKRGWGWGGDEEKSPGAEWGGRFFDYGNEKN